MNISISKKIFKSKLVAGQRETLFDRILVYLFLFLASVFAFFPIYWMVVTSLRPDSEVFAFPPTLFPRQITFEHYLNFFRNSSLRQFLWNSIIVATATSIGSLAVSIFAAFSFSKFRYKGRASLMFLVLIAQMFPQALLLITLYLMFAKLNILDTYLALILSFTTFTLPLSTWMLKGYFDQIPNSIIEAAKIDGASYMQIVFKIVLPVALPALVATGFFSFMRGWNDFIYALTLVKQDKLTLPPGLTLAYIGEFQTEWADMMAASLLVSLPLVLAFVFFQRYIVSGLTSGSVKG